MDEIFDILIVGGGPIGIASGIEAKKAGCYNYIPGPVQTPRCSNTK